MAAFPVVIGVKRTWLFAAQMSANDSNLTFPFAVRHSLG
jgi:hypothetical protein